MRWVIYQLFLWSTFLHVVGQVQLKAKNSSAKSN